MIEQMTKYFSSFLEPKDDQTLHDQCMRWKNRLFSSSPAIIFMLKQLERVGCKLNDSHFLCSNCDLTRSGGFIPSHGILLCQNRLISKQHLEDTLTHELVHAFDHCTTTVDWNNCRQLACSEIRAVSLSGECKFLREFKRGNFTIAKQHQACVRRRALLGISSNPSCSGSAGELALESVFDACFADTTPFDEIY